MDASFASQLRAHRTSAELSQEALAEAARISTSAIEKYERGLRISPHRETVSLLADALRLSGQARADFERAARRKRGHTESDGSAPGTELRAEMTSFVGRENDLDQIVETLRQHRLITAILRELARELAQTTSSWRL